MSEYMFIHPSAKYDEKFMKEDNRPRLYFLGIPTSDKAELVKNAHSWATRYHLDISEVKFIELHAPLESYKSIDYKNKKSGYTEEEIRQFLDENEKFNHIKTQETNISLVSQNTNGLFSSNNSHHAEPIKSKSDKSNNPATANQVHVNTKQLKT